MNNTLLKPFSIRVTKDIDLALNKLQSIGFKKTKFIRLAIEEKLYRDYRRIINELKAKEERYKNNYPSWVYE